MAFVHEIGFTSAWSAETLNWKYTMKVYLSDGTQKSLEFWMNKIIITSTDILFGWRAIPYITKVEGRACVVVEDLKIPFAQDLTLEGVAEVFRLGLHLVDEPLYSFRTDDLQVERIFGFVSYCTCKEGGACAECGVLGCGCIDVCRGRCGTRW
jgi:hypothetical protein